MKNIDNVSIKIQTGVYGQFRNLNNKVWFALGEYVDNAVQSFENNKNLLQKIHNNKYQFEVRITIDWEENIIKIKDNAAGIDSKNFLRAFEPANIPIDNTGLHEFGMGMKTASIWLANLWSVKTKAINENVERYVEFDLKKVLEEKRELLKVESKTKSNDSHYTELVLKDLSINAPSAFQMDKIKRHLASIYRKFIINGDLNLYINDDLLEYEMPEILIAPFYNGSKDKPIRWKKEINFSTGKYSVRGFVAILNTMSTNEYNGLSLFRRGRVIEGSHDEKFRPKVICGQIGSPRYKRIFGELELEGFAVSFNKGSFQEQEDLGALMEAIQTEISAKNFDLYTQAEKFIKPKTNQTNKKVAKKLVKSLKKASKESNLKKQVNDSVSDISNTSLAEKNAKLSVKAKSIDSYEDTLEIKGKTIKLALELITEPDITELYSLIIGEDELFEKYIYKINLAHPFFNRFEKFKNDQDYQPIISIIRSLVFAEILERDLGTKNAGNVRINFNHFLRNM